MLRGIFLSITALLSFSLPAMAASFVSVNEGVVPVDAKREETKAAFEQVIVKMTGTRQSLTLPAISREARKARDYILSYEYFVENGIQQYKAVFDRTKIELLLRAESLPLWGPRRPDAILWLATRDRGEVQLLSDADSTELSHMIDFEAQAKGVKLLRPIMDLDDRLVVSSTDVWARFLPFIEQASLRYQTDIVIAARIIDSDTLREQQKVKQQGPRLDPRKYRPLPGARSFDRNSLTLDEALQQQALLNPYERDVLTVDTAIILPEGQSMVLEWSVINADEIRSGRYFANSESELISRFIDDYAEQLGSEYAITPTQGASENPLITIANVRSLSDMTNVTNYLRDLTVVQSADLSSLQGNVATFNVSLIGSVADLNNTITLDQRLSMVDISNDFQENAVQLHYFWKG